MFKRQSKTLLVLLKVTFFYKARPHAGIAENECADKIAEYQASLKSNNLTDTGIPSAGPGGTFSTILLGWLGRRQDLVHLDLRPPFPI
eukprot:1140170-Pelagomonas_calceolata.AAC.2